MRRGVPKPWGVGTCCSLFLPLALCLGCMGPRSEQPSRESAASPDSREVYSYFSHLACDGGLGAVNVSYKLGSDVAQEEVIRALVAILEVSDRPTPRVCGFEDLPREGYFRARDVWATILSDLAGHDILLQPRMFADERDLAIRELLDWLRSGRR